jgi:hypothetical protein
LKKHENLVVKSRIKECPSAIDALRRRCEGGVFDRDRPENYSLLQLRDLAGVRVLAFPPERASEIDELLHKQFHDWISDPIIDRETGQQLAFKYYGRCVEASERVQCEYQTVSMLIGLFWEVEHAAIYKPAPNFKGISTSPEMQKCTSDVYRALIAFEAEFEHQIENADSTGASSESPEPMA